MKDKLEMDYLCKCLKCDNIYLDTNHQLDAKKLEYSGDLIELVDHKCVECGVDDYLIDM